MTSSLTIARSATTCPAARMRSTSVVPDLSSASLARVGNRQHRDLQRHKLSAFDRCRAWLRLATSAAPPRTYCRPTPCPLSAGREPALPLRRRAVREGVGHDITARLLLQAVVADRRRGLQCRFDVARLERASSAAWNDAPRRRRGNRPAIRPAPGCGWPRPCCRRRAALLAPSAECRAGSARDGRPRARSHRPRANSQALPLQPRKRASHVAEERGVEIDAPVVRAIERPHRRLREAAAALDRAGVQPQPRRAVLLPAALEDFASTYLRYCRAPRRRNRPSGPSARRSAAAGWLVGLLVVPAAVHDLGAADQDARIDAERPADQAEHDDGSDAEAAAPDRDTDAAAAAKPPSSPRLSSTLSLRRKSSQRIVNSSEAFTAIIAELRARVQRLLECSTRHTASDPIIGRICPVASRNHKPLFYLARSRCGLSVVGPASPTASPESEF